MEEKRIEYIDIAKGIGIILVVIGHCIDSHSLPGRWISSFHMPLFFILSGMCFSGTKYPEFGAFLKKRIKTLLLPDLYFSIIVSTVITITSGTSTFDDLIYKHAPHALWFLLILFLAEILYYFIQKYSMNKIITASILILSLITGIILNREGITLSHNICGTFTATFYYGLGHISKNIINKITQQKYRYVSSLVMLMIPLITAYITKDSINLSGNYIPSPYLLFIVVSLLGSLGIIIISATKFNKYGWVGGGGVILYLGQNTLIILALHMMFLDLSCRYIQPLISERLVYKIVEQVFVWLMLYISIFEVNKKAKWLLGKY